MTLNFLKYHGTGNDFILVEDAQGDWELSLTKDRIAHLCHRHFGVGADGLILVQKTGGYDFRMVYYNSDGGESSFCGNGARCAVAFAHHLGWIGQAAWFVAADGDHEARILEDGRIGVHMRSISKVTPHHDDLILDSGSPHYVRFVPDVASVDLVAKAREVRYGPRFRDQGINVNFVEPTAGKLLVRTYERGVEAETLSCGTGVTAAAIAWAYRQGVEGLGQVAIETPGGDLEVQWELGQPYGFRHIWLRGPATMVFGGQITLDAS